MNPTVAAMLGVGLGILLLALGYWLGRRHSAGGVSFGEAEGTAAILSDQDRDRLLAMIRDLEGWTSRYSGDVSEYQAKLVEIQNSIPAQTDADVAAGDNGRQNQNRFVLLISEIIRTNSNLQERLSKAEKQLEQQTRQIESYLSEARTDGLTGLFNRRALDKKLDELFMAYRNGGPGFTLGLIDIDHFKSINDNYGHQAGDQVLRDMGATVRGVLDEALLTARFGGEEFAVILPPPLSVAAGKLEHLRKTIEERTMSLGDQDVQITASIGVSEPRDDAVVAAVIRRADEALYAAKNVGRNRVYLFDGDSPSLLGAPEPADG